MQVTNLKLQCDFLAMAATEEWQDQVKVICDVAAANSGASMRSSGMSAAVSAAEDAISKNPSHPVRRLHVCL